MDVDSKQVEIIKLVCYVNWKGVKFNANTDFDLSQMLRTDEIKIVC